VGGVGGKLRHMLTGGVHLAKGIVEHHSQAAKLALGIFDVDLPAKVTRGDTFRVRRNAVDGLERTTGQHPADAATDEHDGETGERQTAGEISKGGVELRGRTTKHDEIATRRAVEQDPVTGQSGHEVLRSGTGVIHVRSQFGQSLGHQFRLDRCVGGTVKRFTLKVDSLNPNAGTDNLRQGLLGLGRPLFWIVGSAHRLTASTRRRCRTTRTGDTRNDLVHGAHPAGHLPTQAQVDFLEPCLILVAVESDEEDRGRGGEEAKIPSQNPPADGVKNHSWPGAFAAASMT